MISNIYAKYIKNVKTLKEHFFSYLSSHKNKQKKPHYFPSRSWTETFLFMSSNYYIKNLKKKLIKLIIVLE